jgi:hypothetical protein
VEVPIASGAEFIGSHTADLLLGGGASLLCFITSTPALHAQKAKRASFPRVWNSPLAMSK